jgi:hypothetical protein
MRRSRTHDLSGPAELPDYVKAQVLRELNNELLCRLRESAQLVESLRKELKALNERLGSEVSSDRNSDDDKLSDKRPDSVPIDSEADPSGVHPSEVVPSGGEQETEQGEQH